MLHNGVSSVLHNGVSSVLHNGISSVLHNCTSSARIGKYLQKKWLFVTKNEQIWFLKAMSIHFCSLVHLGPDLSKKGCRGNILRMSLFCSIQIQVTNLRLVSCLIIHHLMFRHLLPSLI